MTHAPTTVEELKEALARIDKDPSEVGRAEDPEARKDEGVLLIQRLPDGRCQVVTMGRGAPAHLRDFDTEAAAIRAIAERMLLPRPSGPVRTTEQRRADSARAQAFAQRALREIEERNRQGDDK